MVTFADAALRLRFPPPASGVIAVITRAARVVRDGLAGGRPTRSKWRGLIVTFASMDAVAIGCHRMSTWLASTLRSGRQTPDVLGLLGGFGILLGPRPKRLAVMTVERPWCPRRGPL
jgi:hypothetical protein